MINKEENIIVNFRSILEKIYMELGLSELFYNYNGIRNIFLKDFKGWNSWEYVLDSGMIDIYAEKKVDGMILYTWISISKELMADTSVMEKVVKEKLSQGISEQINRANEQNVRRLSFLYELEKVCRKHNFIIMSSGYEEIVVDTDPNEDDFSNIINIRMAKN